MNSAKDVSVRIGVHTGPPVWPVLGKRKLFDDVWGDSVNTTARPHGGWWIAGLHPGDRLGAMLACSSIEEPHGHDLPPPFTKCPFDAASSLS